MKKGSATITDVARHAGVSIATVSRVLNNSGVVSPEAAEKVNRSIKELSYEMNALASGLKRGKTKVIGLIIPRLTNVFFMQVLEGLEAVVSESGYSIILSVSENDPEKEKKMFDKMSSYMVDGLVIATSTTDGTMFNEGNLPIVLIDRRLKDAKVDMVTDENYLSSRKLARIVIEAGHRRVSVANGLLPHLPFMQERFNACKDALEEAGIPLEERYIVEGKRGRNVTLSEVSAILEEWKEKEIMPTAMISLNGKLTENIMTAARKLGIRVPEDLSLVSFGQLSSELIEPKVTAVIQAGHRIGRKAGELLMAKLEGEGRAMYNSEVIFNCEIEEGNSVKKLE